MNHTVSIRALGPRCCFPLLILTAYIYPFLYNSTAWGAISLICGAIVGLCLISQKNFKINKKRAVWLLTLIPVIINSYAIKSREFGFALLWIILLALLLLAKNETLWIKTSLTCIALTSLVYAIFTILVNIGLARILSGVAMAFRGPLQTGSLQSAGLTAHYSHNGMYIAVGGIIAYSAMLSKKDIKTIGGLAIYFIGLLFTQKRGPLIAAVLTCVLVFYFSQRGSLSKRLNRMVILSLVFTAVIYLLYILFPSLFGVFERFSANENILTNRQYLWLHAIDLFKSSPIIGHGWGFYSHNFNMVINTVNVSNYYTHNVYLQLLAETGLIGLVCFLIPMILGKKGRVSLPLRALALVMP